MNVKQKPTLLTGNTLKEYLTHRAEKKALESSFGKKEQLLELKKAYENCKYCPLSTQGRTQVVFGEGNPEAQLMFIGEGPGRDEDQQGVPFIGRAGKLLNKIIEAMGFNREDAYITNTVKCRPPKNRAPLPEESFTCKNLMLFREVEIIQPKIICTLGASALQAVLGQDYRITRSRGTFYEFLGYKIMPTYHPAYLLRNPSAKRLVWEDMKKIIKEMSK